MELVITLIAIVTSMLAAVAVRRQRAVARLQSNGRGAAVRCRFKP